MGFLFAPNHTLESYTTFVTPFFSYPSAINITLTTSHRYIAHNSFYSAYQAVWGSNTFPIGLDTSLPANRIVLRLNFEKSHNETFALTKEHTSSGKHFLGYHKASGRYDKTDNAVSPAWHKHAILFITSSNKSPDRSTLEAHTIANKDPQEDVL
jgi:hypothetical protein